MSEMIVQVRNKMLRRIGGVNHFVSHNKDYTIQFQFDESWDNVRTKMAVFAYEDGEYGSEIFDGDTCNVPELPREGRILIGVKAGEDLSTELLCIPVCKSADDVITDEYDEPDPKIYEQILDIINNLWNGGTTVYPSPVRFLAAPSTAKVGDLIRVKEVDENGEIKETESVDVEKELVVVNITEDADGVLHADMTYDEINPLRYTHAVYANWASGMYPYSTSARMYFGEDLKNVFVFSSSMAGMENWRIAIAQDGSVKINSYKLELVGRKVQTIDETTGTGDDSEKNYPSAKAVYDALANAKDKDAVKFVEQELTEEQKQQARTNIGAGTSNFSGSYNDLNDQPNIPAATVIDTTLSKSGQAADAKAVGDAIEKKIEAPQVAKVGDVLTVEAVDADGKPVKWKTQTVETEPPNWNENDSTKPGYIKNRPFYTDIIEKTFESSADNRYIEFNGVPFEAGDSVDITVDGEIFTLIAQADANPEFPEMIYGAYIGDSYDELQSGSGQYGWQYYYFKEGNVNSILSFENHIFIYKTAEDHKLDMKYSPVKLKATRSNKEVMIDTLYFNSSIYTKGLHLEYDESKNQFELTTIDNNQTCSVTLVLSNGHVIGDTLNKEYKFDVFASIKVPYQKGLFNFQYYRILFNGFVLNNRGYYAVITSTTANQYTNDEFANTEHYTGTFATVEGYLYFVDLEVVVSVGNEVQKATVKAKRIM